MCDIFIFCVTPNGGKLMHGICFLRDSSS